jgi:hypothetical protein
VKYLSHLVRGLLVAVAASSLTGCIVIPSGHRYHAQPRVAVEVHGRYQVPPPRYEPRYEDLRSGVRRYEHRRYHDDDQAGPRRY